jgi:hypothetical protein
VFFDPGGVQHLPEGYVDEVVLMVGNEIHGLGLLGTGQFECSGNGIHGGAGSGRQGLVGVL